MNEPPPEQVPSAACWWHPSRPTGLSCVRCGRAACPDCLREAPVGYQCVDCAHETRRPRRRSEAGTTQVAPRPVITSVLIALNVLVYGFTTLQARNPVDNDRAALFGDWVLWPRAIAGADEWWRLVTSGFLHYGPIHLGVNMISLWILGRDMEALFGKLRFSVIYLVSLLGGAVSVYLMDDSNRGTAGASGAIYGLLGGLLVVVLRLRLNPMPAIVTIALNLVITLSIPNISLLGHLGGLVAGALVTAAIIYAPSGHRKAWQVVSVAVLVLALAALVWSRDADLAGVVCDHKAGQLLCSAPSGT
ncbi:rhomboid family intramembrane serine protease [Amycolatopsis pigmentata]|uniref:Rhomboid family intramembrane serine protease n=1 Tax=Amycolatopsis pigmentata TaxID=450801 RepID=A0ABW5FT46_9PSEU